MPILYHLPLVTNLSCIKFTWYICKEPSLTAPWFQSVYLLICTCCACLSRWVSQKHWLPWLFSTLPGLAQYMQLMYYLAWRVFSEPWWPVPSPYSKAYFWLCISCTDPLRSRLESHTKDTTNRRIPHVQVISQKHKE